MKKIIIMCSLVASGFSLAQSDNPYVYNQPETSELQEERAPAEPGDPGSVSINDYIPALFIVATILAFAASHKKRQAEKN